MKKNESEQRGKMKETEKEIGQERNGGGRKEKRTRSAWMHYKFFI
jgi:hypothetical protein